MKTTFKSLLAIFSFLFLSAFSLNAQTLKEAWTLYNKNKNQEAKLAFEACAKDPSTKAEAELALAFLEDDDDHEDLAFQHFTRFYDASENPFPYLYALWWTGLVMDGAKKLDAPHMAFLQKIMKDPRANGTIKALCQSQLGYHYAKLGNFKQSYTEFGKIGALENWQVLGTFDNTSGNGFNKDFGVLNAGNQSETKFKNKVGATIKWFDAKNIRKDKWFDFSFYLGVSNSIMYAQTFVESPTAQDVWLRAGCGGTFRVWVNDKLVISEAEERDCDVDVFNYKIKLNEGANRILVQIGESENDNANFMIRLTDENANPLNLKSSTTYQTYAKGTSKGKHLSFFAEEYFDKLVEKDPNNIMNVLMQARIYLRDERMFEVRKALKHAMELAPNNAHVIMRMMNAYNRDGNQTDYSKLEEKLKTKTPDNMQSLKLRYSEANSKEDFVEVEKLIDRMEELYGVSEATTLKRINLLLSQKKIDDAIKMINSAYSKYPENTDFVAFKYKVVQNVSKSNKKANAVLLKYFKTNYDDDVLTTIAGNYFDMGKFADGLQLYQLRAQNEPYKVDFYDDLATLYYNRQDYKTALEWQQKTIEQAPYASGLWNSMGRIYEAQNEKEEAIKAYKKAIYFDPTDYDARKKLRELQEKKEMFANFDSTNIDDLIKAAPKAEDYPEDNSVVLLNETQFIFYPEGASEERNEILIKILKPAGVEDWKEYSVSYNSYGQNLTFDKAEVIKENGDKTEAERNDSYCVFTGLEVGDVIHISYKVQNYQSTKLSQHFFDKFGFNYRYPCKLSRYSMLVPNKKDFNWRVNNSNMQPVVTDIDNYKRYVWEMRDQPGMKAEPYMPPAADCGITLEYSSMPDWKYVANWYSDLSSSKAKGDFEIKEAVAEIFKDKASNLSELQKVKVIYDYIEKNMNYSNVSFLHSAQIPQRASRTLNTKLGDCKDLATLFVAMCNEVNIKASLMLVDTRDNGDHDMILPSTAFNHCIATVICEGKEYIVELTDNKLSFSTIPDNERKSLVLRIPREVITNDSVQVNLEQMSSVNRPLNTITRVSNVSFKENDLIVNRTTYRSGDFASAARSAYGASGKEQQEKDMTQTLSSDFKNVLKLNKLEFSDLKELLDTVTYTYNFTVKNEVNEVAGLHILKMPWSDCITSLDFVSLEKRNYDFLLWKYAGSEQYYEKMLVEVPAGLKFAEVPKNTSIENDFVSYSVTYKMVGAKMEVVRKLRYKKDVITPAEYLAFKDTMNKISSSDNKQLGFK